MVEEIHLINRLSVDRIFLNFFCDIKGGWQINQLATLRGWRPEIFHVEKRLPMLARVL